MVTPPLPISPNLAVTVSDLKTLRQLAESGQLKTWQAGAILDVVVNRREGGLLMLETDKGMIGLPVPADNRLKAGTALQLHVLALAPLQVQLRPVPTPNGTSEMLTQAFITKSLPARIATPEGVAPPSTNRPLSTPPLLAPGIPIAITPNTNNPVEQLTQQLAAVLRPLLTHNDPVKLTLLPARITEWLARLAPHVPAADSDAVNTVQTPAVEWSRLATTLLNTWPRSHDADEPEQLETLLRQALFGERAAVSTSQSTPQARTANTDWLGTLLRLLAALPSASSTTQAASSATALNTPAFVATPSIQTFPTNAPDEAAPSPSTLLPLLPDEIIDELASLLGKHQQLLLNNLQSEMRQQPLYAELLLRHNERLDPFQLSIREDKSQRNQHSDDDTDSQDRHHVVRLRFDLPGLGTCQFLLDLQADELQLNFYSEQANTVALFNEHVDTLASTLAADAIHLNAVQSHCVDQLPAIQTPTETGFHAKA